MNPNTQQLHAVGQSLWLDNISRQILADGTLAHYIIGPVGDRADVQSDHLRAGDQEQARSTTPRSAELATGPVG